MAKRSNAEVAEESISALHPKLSEQLIGQEPAEKQLLALINNKQLPHALLLAGPRGVGKATLAWRLARFLLASQNEDNGLFGEPLPPESLSISSSHPIFRRLVAGSHPDILVLEAEDIKVESARLVGEFLAHTPAESTWRVVIIDSADALNRNAANSLLKILEEPPDQAMLLLISHNPGTLLPTIRSRCRLLRVPPLTEENFAHVMAQAAPDLMPHDYRVWAILSEYSPGVALTLIEQKADRLYQELCEQIANRDTLKYHSFAERFARKEQNKEWQVLKRLILWLCWRVTTQNFEYEIFIGERRILERLHTLKPRQDWIDLWEKAGKLLSDTDHLHLDRKQTILTLLRAISE
jgi:DNA polymerase-3 subunit delta'